MGYSILLVDDDAEVLSINKKYFESQGQPVNVKIAADATTAMGILRTASIDCVVLDVMMPGMDGFELCDWIKRNCSVPVIFLTGRDSEDDKVSGLLLGADDYMVKPYSLRELGARIQVLIRRYTATSAPADNILSFPFLSIDLNNRVATYEGERISLSAKELDFLILLARSPQKIFTFEEIGNAVWGDYLESDRKTIMVTASRLRKKLDSYSGIQGCIETVWSQGYKFILTEVRPA